MGIGKILGYTILGAGVEVLLPQQQLLSQVEDHFQVLLLQRHLQQEQEQSQQQLVQQQQQVGLVRTWLIKRMKKKAKNEKLKKAFYKTLSTLKNDKAYFTFILGMTGLGISNGKC